MEFEGSCPSPELEALQGEGWKELAIKFPKLSEKKIAILRMSMEGWTHSEIAAHCGKSVEAIDKELSRILLFLKRAALCGELTRAELAEMISCPPPTPTTFNI